MLTRWDPFSELLGIQERLTSNWMRGGGGNRGMAGYVPAVDIHEGQDAITITAELPGLDAKDVQINIENNVLTVQGERRFEHEDKQEGYHRVERSYGSFFRSFALPNSVNAEQIEANMSQGVLTIVLPKVAGKQARKIDVRASTASTTASMQPGAQLGTAGTGSTAGTSSTAGTGSTASVSSTAGGTGSTTGAASPSASKKVAPTNGNVPHQERR